MSTFREYFKEKQNVIKFSLNILLNNSVNLVCMPKKNVWGLKK